MTTTKKKFFNLTAIFTGCPRRAVEFLLKRKLFFCLGKQPLGLYYVSEGRFRRVWTGEGEPDPLDYKVTGVLEWVPPTAAGLGRATP